VRVQNCGGGQGYVKTNEDFFFLGVMSLRGGKIGKYKEKGSG
jgi:hypothetical protein